MATSRSKFNKFYYRSDIQPSNDQNQDEKIKNDFNNFDDLENDDINQQFCIFSLKKLNLLNYKELIDELKKFVSFDYKNMHKRYEKIIHFLKSQTCEYWEGETIQYPNIFLTKYDKNRFNFDKDIFIQMVNRNKLVNDYIEYIQNNDNLYIYGLIGVGKSFIIYQMVAKMMTMEDKYRIIYVNQSDANIWLDTFEIVRTIVWNDYCKNEEMKNLLDKFIQSFIFKELDNTFEISYLEFKKIFLIISNIANEYKKVGIEFIFVFDQVNLILRDSKLDDQYSFLSNMILRNKTIISASANNEHHKQKLKNTHRKIPPTGLNFNEFKSFLSFYPKASKYIKTLGDANQVMSLTGAVPLELNRFLNQDDANGLHDMINKYISNFEGQNNFGHSQIADCFSISEIKKWFNELQDEKEKQDAIKNITRCVLNQPLPNNICDLFDKRIFSLEIINGSAFLKPFSCLAMSCALEFYNQFLKNPLIDELNSIINSYVPFDEAIIGKCIERFIIYSLSANAQFSNLTQSRIKFPVHIIQKQDNKIKHNKKDIIFSDYDVVHFAGLTVPPLGLNLAKNKLFIPLDPKYPGFDFFYFQSSSNGENKQYNLFCFQITIEKSPMNHVIRNDENFYSKKIPPELKAQELDDGYIDNYRESSIKNLKKRTAVNQSSENFPSKELKHQKILNFSNH